MSEISPNLEISTEKIFSDVCNIIDDSRTRIAVYVNSEVCLTRWYVGKRIKEDVLYNKRAEYGKQIVKNLAVRLTERYGKGWGYECLKQSIRCFEYFSQDEIGYAVRTQFSWSHIRSLMGVKDPLARQFYMEMCKIEKWGTRTLDEKIDSQLFERTAISRKPEELIKKELQEVRTKGNVTPDLVFKSSYFLDMLGLPDYYSESDLENSIINQIMDFIKELGPDFALVDRQKRIPVDSVDYYLDLLFYHRGLRRLVAIDLKIGKFKPAYEGQMLLYLRYLDKNDRKEWEESPIGLVLCSEGNTEHVEYMMLGDNSQIRVAQYYTQLPDKKLLAERLQRAVKIAKENCKYREEDV